MTVCPRGGVEYLGYLLSHVPSRGRVTLPTLDSRGYFGCRCASYRNACLFVFNASKTYDVYFRKGLTNRKAYKPPPDVEDRVERITSPHCEAGQDWRQLELTDPTLKYKVSMLELTNPTLKYKDSMLELTDPTLKYKVSTLELTDPTLEHTDPTLKFKVSTLGTYRSKTQI